jgi:hypothetical protein
LHECLDLEGFGVEFASVLGFGDGQVGEGYVVGRRGCGGGTGRERDGSSEEFGLEVGFVGEELILRRTGSDLESAADLKSDYRKI